MTAVVVGLYYLRDAHLRQLQEPPKWASQSCKEASYRLGSSSLLFETLPVIPAAKTQKGWLMPKALCLIGMVLAILVFLIFLIDLLFGVSGMTDYAPFRSASILMDVLFLISSAAVATMAWLTFKEQR